MILGNVPTKVFLESASPIYIDALLPLQLRELSFGTAACATSAGELTAWLAEHALHI